MEELGNYFDIENPLDFSSLDGLDELPGPGSFPAQTNHNELGLGTPVSDWNGTWEPPDSSVNPGSHGKSLDIILDGNARNEIMEFAEEVKQNVAIRWETQRERDAALRMLATGLDPREWPLYHLLLFQLLQLSLVLSLICLSYLKLLYHISSYNLPVLSTTCLGLQDINLIIGIIWIE